MANYSYPHVEDYIEIIAGYKSVAGKATQSIFQAPESILSLARYDVKMLESLADQTMNRNVAYTDRQAKLATDIVVKYERQLLKHGVDITPVKVNPQFRTPIRVLDRSSQVWIEGDQIRLRFPYNPDIIELVRTQSKESSGAIKFDRDKKIWIADLTEPNVNWAYMFAQQNNFTVDPSLRSAMDLIFAAEQVNYRIELKAGTDTLSITNAAESLVDYVNEKLGGFGTDNLLKLVDSAPMLGYTAEQIIEDVVIQAYGPRFWSLCVNKELKVEATNNYAEQLNQIVEYARVTNRYPIFVYEPDQSNRLAMILIRQFTKEQIVNLDDHGEVTADTRLVYCTRVPKLAFNHIPLLLTSAGMIFGGDRQVWLQNAEKVVYFTKEVYNKTVKKGKEICKLN